MTTRREFMIAAPAAATALAVGGGFRFGARPAHADEPWTPEELARDVVTRRAIEAMIWGMPAVNFDCMYQAMLNDAKGQPNQIVYWSRLLDWKNQTLTPNTDVIYLMPFFDTRNVGPIVIEIPPADDGVINGTLMDAWQMPLEDLGPAGADEGKGGKYLVLPPDYTDAWPEGYTVLPSLTYQGYGLIRSILKSGSDADLAKAVEYGRRIKLYPLSKAAAPPTTTYVDADGILFDATIPYDVRFFESLDRMVQAEPWLQRDRAMIDTLRSLGIQKGKPFAPDPDMRQRLDDAAIKAHALLDSWFEDVFIPPWAEGSRWAFPASHEFVQAVQSGYADPNYYPIDDRGVLFTFIFFTPKRLGEGQLWLMTHQDKNGAPFEGSRPYRLTVPPDVPIRQYWSATVYDRRTHALVRKMERAGRSSQSPGLEMNADGSVDLYFGPTAPDGKEANWTPTSADGEFEVLFRFYGPLAPLWDKSWVLPDLEEVV